ncbi:DMT family transporter [Alkanindiges illinoisensis]|uniref:DMT family transporter n=1 Tax=Alkanindiges illinoisensis TaxID=197183 RepID=UPI0004795002|nr:DMT family transporter [Alkanindiges illinoisensis]
MKGLELSTLLMLGLAGGIALASQAGVNAQLRQYVNSPYQAAFLSFLVGTVILGAVVMLQTDSRPQLQHLLGMPLWLWVGGLLGAFGVSVSIILAPRLGAVNLTIIIVCGQLLASLVLDHFGWLGFEKHTINWQRIAGALMVMAGLVLTVKY